MWFYPLPAFIALIGWIYVAATPDQRQYIGTAFLLLFLGLGVYFLRARLVKRWPFENQQSERATPLPEIE